LIEHVRNMMQISDISKGRPNDAAFFGHLGMLFRRGL
jgi:hypothetical protein